MANIFGALNSHSDSINLDQNSLSNGSPEADGSGTRFIFRGELLVDPSVMASSSSPSWTLPDYITASTAQVDVGLSSSSEGTGKYQLPTIQASVDGCVSARSPGGVSELARAALVRDSSGSDSKRMPSSEGINDEEVVAIGFGEVWKDRLSIESKMFMKDLRDKLSGPGKVAFDKLLTEVSGLKPKKCRKGISRNFDGMVSLLEKYVPNIRELVGLCRKGVLPPSFRGGAILPQESKAICDIAAKKLLPFEIAALHQEAKRFNDEKEKEKDKLKEGFGTIVLGAEFKESALKKKIKLLERELSQYQAINSCLNEELRKMTAQLSAESVATAGNDDDDEGKDEPAEEKKSVDRKRKTSPSEFRDVGSRDPKSAVLSDEDDDDDDDDDYLPGMNVNEIRKRRRPEAH